MHYSTCAVILAAGSSIASASTSMKDLFDIPSIARREAFFMSTTQTSRANAQSKATAGKVNTPAAKPNTPAVAAKPADNKAVNNVVQASIGQLANKALAKPVQKATSNQQSAEDAADAAQMRRAAKQAAVYMDAYQEYHPPKKGQKLADDMPPPMNFQFSNNYGTQTSYSGPVTDNRQFAAAGAIVASGSASIKSDNSQTDNSQKSFGGGINGNSGSTKNSRRSVDDTYEVKEDGRVVYRDFVLLVKAMKRDSAAKEQVLYEIAGVPGFRSLVENLIQQYTDTNGELTMDNFAALVDAMTKDKTTEVDAIKAFNSNLVYAALIEKLLMKYYIPEDQGLSGSSKKEKRDFDNELFSLTIRDIDDDYLQMEARDFYEEYYWLASRGLDEETSELLVRDLEAYMGYDPELFY